MKKWVIVILIIAMGAWAVFEFVSGKEENNAPVLDESTEVGLEKGDLAPDFELKMMDGKAVKLSDFRGEPVMLNFWATWCPPCRAEMPDMQKFYENQGAQILAVDLFETEAKIETVEEFLEDYEVTFDVLLDENSEVSTKYGIQPIPTTYMIDSDGVIQNMAFGALNYDLMVQEFEKMK